jgi:polar amino acid transport system permease protein
MADTFAVITSANTKSKGIRIKSRPWYRRNELLIAVAVFLLLWAVLLLPGFGRPTLLGWLKIVIFFTVLLITTGIVITDTERPLWQGAVSAGALIAVFCWLFYRYSGAKWDRLAFVFFNWKIMAGGGWSSIFKALLRTLELGFLSLIAAFVLGLFLAVLRTIGNKVFTFFVILYVNVFRAIPVIVLAAFVYYALPYLGITLSTLVAGIVTLGLNHAAFSSEIFRAGIESIHHGQIESAYALGFNAWKTMRLVILPQAIRVVVPPLTGQMVALLKETAICSTIGVLELMRQALIIQAWKANPTPLIVATGIYVLFLVPLTLLSRYLERKMKRGGR